MWRQIEAIAWAQWRITRNHLPRTGAGAWLMAILGIVWYCGFAAGALGILALLSAAEPQLIETWLPAGLLGVCAFWQIVPLVTLTGGWSLNLKKLQSFPVPINALFHIEVLLRLTTAFEMVLLVVGAFIGLLLNPSLSKPASLFLLILIPFNLLLSLGIREFILHSFARNRLREIFALLIISLSLLPQVLVRSSLGGKATPYALGLSRGRLLPWSEVALLSTGHISLLSIGALLLWISMAYWFARGMFVNGLREEEAIRATAAQTTTQTQTRSFWESIIAIPGGIFADPLAALIQKEIRALVRMPRFRVMFGLACFVSIVIFLPMSRGNVSFMRGNFAIIAGLYGMLILSDALFWNVFGFDGSAAQIYFAGPVELKQVLQAKNLTALLFIVAQNAVVLTLSLLLRLVANPLSIVGGVSATAVVAIFFLAAGNLSSVTSPRMVDPAQTLKRQTSGQRQLWLLGCSLAMFLLVGLAMLASWAVRSEWALIGVLAVEFGIGVIVFRVSTDSAVARGLAHREEIIDALSNRGSQVAI